ncbi:MAG: hypothetical protein ACD_21C00052G0018 [uncultured bacterium]|nr:MAG: hypothetical protein ACD_21C00052G0018 [uncultured bacterium]
MSETTSTETVILTSIWCRKMSGLLKYIYKYSTASKKKNTSTPIPLLSPQQIQEARQHPSTAIQQALGTVAEIQRALNAALSKLKTLTEQRHSIESTLTELKTLSEKNDQEPPENESLAKELKQQLAKLHQSEKDLEIVTEKLNKELDNVDKTLIQHADEWLKHREEYLDKLATNLETKGLALTNEEKAEMRNYNTAIVQTKLKELKKIQIDISEKASDFAIIAYDTIVAALSRTLQKIDNKTLKNIIKN